MAATISPILKKEVIIRLPEKDISVTEDMRLYDGIRTIISWASIRKHEEGLTFTQYELEGVVSRMGVPYTFTRDMFELVEEVE